MKKLSPILLVLLMSCSGKGEGINPNFDSLDSCNNGTIYRIDTCEIKHLDLSERYYINESTEPQTCALKDDKGVILHDFRGALNYHPIVISQFALKNLDVYRRTKNPKALRSVEIQSNKLSQMALKIDSTLLFPYSFNYPFNEKDKMKAPWYSGMSQGTALSLYSRLFELTLDSSYLNQAKLVFNSFSRFKSNSEIWFCCVDKNENLWIEEYPHALPSHVLNGMIFSLFGLYDYYLISNDGEALQLIKGCLLTLSENMNKFREENTMSYYCLKYDVRNYNYQRIHIDQFKQLYKMTGNTSFNEFAQLLEEDAKVAPPEDSYTK